MSSTKIHDGACVVVAIVNAGLGAAFHPYFMGIALGSLCGLLLSPDLDWDGMVVADCQTDRKYLLTEQTAGRGEVNVRKVYGKVLRRWPFPLRQWWMVYARLFRHRRVSHHPFWGTLSRLLWLVFPLPLVYFIPQFALVLLGVFLADLTHLGLDKI